MAEISIDGIQLGPTSSHMLLTIPLNSRMGNFGVFLVNINQPQKRQFASIYERSIYVRLFQFFLCTATNCLLQTFCFIFQTVLRNTFANNVDRN